MAGFRTTLNFHVGVPINIVPSILSVLINVYLDTTHIWSYGLFDDYVANKVMKSKLCTSSLLFYSHHSLSSCQKVMELYLLFHVSV